MLGARLLQTTKSDRQQSPIDRDFASRCRNSVECFLDPCIVVVSGDTHTSKSASHIRRPVGTYSDVKSPQPIKSTSTPGTLAIELDVRCDRNYKSTCTYSTSSRALTVSIIQITVVNSLQSGFAYFAGIGAYRNIGIVPVAERSPIGANLA
jgi:hypothetical protein